MKITELIKELEKAKNSVGDVEVCTDGYFGTLEIEDLKITTWGEKGRYMGKFDMYGTRIYENDFLFDTMESNVFLVRWIDWMAGWGTEKDGDEGAIYDIVGYCKVAGNKWEGKPNE